MHFQPARPFARQPPRRHRGRERVSHQHFGHQQTGTWDPLTEQHHFASLNSLLSSELLATLAIVLEI